MKADSTVLPDQIGYEKYILTQEYTCFSISNKFGLQLEEKT